MEHKFHIGQDIVAIKDHSQGDFKEGDVFPIKGLKQGCYNKNKLLIDIGKYVPNQSTFCRYCANINEVGVQWYNSICFKPLDELTNIEELKEVLEKPIFK